jgi:hypothetical protein
MVRTVPLAGKVMGTVFWNAEEFILIDLLLKWETIIVAHYVQMLRKCSVLFVKSA